jgi:hypothetical protein
MPEHATHIEECGERRARSSGGERLDCDQGEEKRGEGRRGAMVATGARDASSVLRHASLHGGRARVSRVQCAHLPTRQIVAGVRPDSGYVTYGRRLIEW